MTDLQKTRIIQMRQSNQGYGKIATFLGLNKETLRSWCKRHELGGFRAGSEKAEDKPEKGPIFCSDGCCNEFWKENRFLIKQSRKAIYTASLLFSFLHQLRIFTFPTA